MYNEKKILRDKENILKSLNENHPKGGYSKHDLIDILTTSCGYECHLVFINSILGLIIVLLLILSFAFTAHAQFRNGQRNGQRQQRQGPMTPSAQKAPKPNFKVEKYIGIVVYDVKKAAKKSSIKLLF